MPLHLEPAKLLAIVFRGRELGKPRVPHLRHSPFEATSVSEAGPRTLEARVLADRAGEHALTGAAGGRSYAGTVHVEGSFAPIELGGDWRFRFDRTGEAWTQRPLGSWTELAPDYSGAATYQKEVELSADDLASGRRLILDLGEVRDTAHVTINGAQVGRLLWEPYRLDVTDAVRPGSNLIEVRAANTPANERGTPRRRACSVPSRSAGSGSSRSGSLRRRWSRRSGPPRDSRHAALALPGECRVAGCGAHRSRSPASAAAAPPFTRVNGFVRRRYRTLSRRQRTRSGASTARRCRAPAGW